MIGMNKPDGSYSVSDIQDYNEYIIKKYSLILLLTVGLIID